MRFKNRYFLFDVVYDTALRVDAQTNALRKSQTGPTAKQRSLHGKAIQRAIRDAVQDNFGDYGIGVCAASLQVKYYNALTSTGIIRAPRDHFEMIWAAVSLIRQLDGQPCMICVRRVTGTIRHAQEHAIVFAERSIKRHKLQEAELHQVERDVMQLDP